MYLGEKIQIFFPRNVDFSLFCGSKNGKKSAVTNVGTCVYMINSKIKIMSTFCVLKSRNLFDTVQAADDCGGGN